MSTIFYLVLVMIFWSIFFAGIFVAGAMFVYSDLSIRKNQIIIAAAIGDVYIGASLLSLFLDGYFAGYFFA